MTHPKTKDVEIPEEIVEKWQKTVNIMAEIIDVPSGLIMRVKPPLIEVFRSSESDENPYEVGDTEDLAGLYCEKVIESEDMLLVPNARKNEKWKDNPDVELGMISYLGFPLRWPDGDFFGTICVLDSEEKHYSEKYQDLMEQFGKLVESHLKSIYQRNELKKQIKEKEKAEQREEFLHSLIGHDVSNKAQIVQVYLELAEDYDLPEEVKEYLSKARKATQDGIEIIEKVKVLRKTGEEEIEKINIQQVIKNVVSKTKSPASEKGIDMECVDCECKVKGGSLLKELFSNLIENSIAHCRCKNIKISAKKTEKECIVTIEDDGIGIPDERKERIFEKGYKKGESAGSGLGLYLVKEIVESYGGSIEVGDSELGGAKFDVHLQKV